MNRMVIVTCHFCYKICNLFKNNNNNNSNPVEKQVINVKLILNQFKKKPT